MLSKKKLLYKPPPAQDYSRNFCKLYIVIAISFVFITAQFVGGYISGSLSVISDAFHLVTDLIGFTISFGFIYFSRKPPTQKMSFGFHRMEVLGAIGNLFVIWFLAIFLIYEATDRIIKKEFVEEPLAMLIVGVGGLAVNIVMYFVLHSGSHSHGLMSEQCNHHHQPHDNDPVENQCTTSFCNQLLCIDEDCIKQVNKSHCHVKNPKGQEKIHIHDKRIHENKGIMEIKIIGNREQIDNSKMNLKSDDAKHQQNCQDHHSNRNQVKERPEIMNKFDIQGQIEHQQHKHGQNCSHNHGPRKNYPKKLPKLENQNSQHKHGQGCKHDHKHEHNHQHDHKHQHHHQHQHNHQHDHSKCGNKHNHKHDTKQTKIVQSQSHNNLDGHNHHDHNHNQDHHDHDHGHSHDHGHQHGHNHDHGHESISMKAAVLHALSDVIQSIGLLISSLFIFFLGADMGHTVHQWNNWHYLDPISTYIFSIIVIISTFPILKNCYYLIMQATPSTQEAIQIRKKFEETEGVVDVHDLHIWSLRPGKNMLNAHVFAKEGEQRKVLTKLTQICRLKKIFHSTLQVEEVNWKNHDEYILCDHDIH